MLSGGGCGRSEQSGRQKLRQTVSEQAERTHNQLGRGEARSELFVGVLAGVELRAPTRGRPAVRVPVLLHGRGRRARGLTAFADRAARFEGLGHCELVEPLRLFRECQAAQ